MKIIFQKKNEDSKYFINVRKQIYNDLGEEKNKKKSSKFDLDVPPIKCIR